MIILEYVIYVVKKGKVVDILTNIPISYSGVNEISIFAEVKGKYKIGDKIE